MISIHYAFFWATYVIILDRCGHLPDAEGLDIAIGEPALHAFMLGNYIKSIVLSHAMC